jgi:hypothetical protein
LLLPLASRSKISSSRSVRTARIALAALSLVLVTGKSRSRMRCRSFPAIWEEMTDSPAAVALTAAMIAFGGAVLSM